MSDMSYAVAVASYGLSRQKPRQHLIDEAAERVIFAGIVGAAILDMVVDPKNRPRSIDVIRAVPLLSRAVLADIDDPTEEADAEGNYFRSTGLIWSSEDDKRLPAGAVLVIPVGGPTYHQQTDEEAS